MEYFRTKDQNLERKFNTLREDYDNMFIYGEFSLTFYGAFQSDKDFYGKEIIENLYKVC